MIKQMNMFQVAVIGIFGFSILIALFVFATQGGGKKDPSQEQYGEVLVWGTLPKNVIDATIREIDLDIDITYVQKPETTLQQDLYRAPFSNQKSPDLIIFPQGEYLNYRIFLAPIDPTYLTERQFVSTFVEQAEMYIEEEGIYAVPLMVDPMVMYWNRNIFSSNAVSTIPNTWDDFRVLVPKMKILDTTTSIKRSVLPFGEFVNVTHVKDIISMLIMQAGAPVVTSEKGVLTVNVNSPVKGVLPGVTAFNFFVEFSNQSLPTYNWNRTLPPSKEMFIAGDSAVYFGYASEIPEIEKTNPHLNFDVAMVPQRRGAETKLTYGRMVGIGLLDSSQNIFGAHMALNLLSGLHGDTTYVRSISEGLGLPPAHRVLLGETPSDRHRSVFYEAANISRSWPDPSDRETDRVFETAIEGILSNRFKTDVAVSTLEKQLQQIINEYIKENKDV